MLSVRAARLSINAAAKTCSPETVANGVNCSDTTRTKKRNGAEDKPQHCNSENNGGVEGVRTRRARPITSSACCGRGSCSFSNHDLGTTKNNGSGLLKQLHHCYRFDARRRFGKKRKKQLQRNKTMVPRRLPRCIDGQQNSN